MTDRVRRQYDWDKILTLWEQGVPTVKIAREARCRNEIVTRIVHQARIKGDPRALHRYTVNRGKFWLEASKRGMTTRALRALILETVERENLFDAILEDEE